MRSMLLLGLLLFPAAAMAAEDAPPPAGEMPPKIPVTPQESEAPPPGTEVLPELQVAPQKSEAPPPGSEVPPELQVAPQEGEAPSPEVTIKRRGTETIEEYSVSGRVYMVKVTPAVGPAYYLVDPTGQGEFSQQINDIKNPPPVPRWVLLRW